MLLCQLRIPFGRVTCTSKQIVLWFGLKLASVCIDSCASWAGLSCRAISEQTTKHGKKKTDPKYTHTLEQPTLTPNKNTKNTKNNTEKEGSIDQEKKKEKREREKKEKKISKNENDITKNSPGLGLSSKLSVGCPLL